MFIWHIRSNKGIRLKLWCLWSHTCIISSVTKSEKIAVSQCYIFRLLCDNELLTDMLWNVNLIFCSLRQCFPTERL